MEIHRTADIQDLQGEIWRQIKNEPFMASSVGRIKNIDKGCIIRSYAGKRGYLRVNKVEYSALVHRLVAIAFINNPNNKPEINHKDGNRQNNNVDNLEWVTCQENIQHAFDSGIKSAKGEKNNFSKLTEDQVTEIRVNYKKGTWGFKKFYADKFKIHPDTVKNIYLNRSWRQ